MQEIFDFPSFGHEVDIEEVGKVFFFFGSGNSFGIEPSDEEFEGFVFFVGKPVHGILRATVFLLTKDVAEKARAVAEEFLVECPVRILGADVDVATRLQLVCSSGRWK